MTAWQNFPQNLVQPEIRTAPRPRFSLTSDIISWLMCSQCALPQGMELFP